MSARSPGADDLEALTRTVKPKYRVSAIAAMCDVSVPTVYAWKRGESVPSEKAIAILERRLKIPRERWAASKGSAA